MKLPEPNASICCQSSGFWCRKRAASSGHANTRLLASGGMASADKQSENIEHIDPHDVRMSGRSPHDVAPGGGDHGSPPSSLSKEEEAGGPVLHGSSHVVSISPSVRHMHAGASGWQCLHTLMIEAQVRRCFGMAIPATSWCAVNLALCRRSGSERQV